MKEAVNNNTTVGRALSRKQEMADLWAATDLGTTCLMTRTRAELGQEH